MIHRLVFWGVCAVIVFVPLPFGSVEEWAIFVFEAATLALFFLYLGGVVWMGRRARTRSWTEAGIGDGAGEGADIHRRSRIPRLFRVLLLIFVLFSIVQVLPLPPGIVKILSPHAHDIYQGLAAEGLGGWHEKARWTLSFAPHTSMGKLVLMICYGLFGFLVLRVVRTKRRMEIFVLAMIASGCFQAFYGLTEFFSGAERIFGYTKRYGVGSVTGTYVNRNHFAGFLEMIFPLSLGYVLAKARYFLMDKGLSLREKVLWFSQERLQWTMLLGLVSVFIGTGLLFSKSRSGVTIFLLTVLLAAVVIAGWRTFSVANGRRARNKRDDAEAEEIGEESEETAAAAADERRRFGRIIRVIFAIVLIAAFWLGVDPIVRRFADIDLTKAARRVFYRNTVELIGDFPLFGTGMGTFVHSYAMYEKIDDWKQLSYAHNDYLQYMAENGVVAGGCLILAGVGLFVFLVARWRRRRDNFAKAVGLGALLGILALLIHGFTDFNLQIPSNVVYFLSLCALTVNLMVGGIGDGGRRGDGYGGEFSEREIREKEAEERGRRRDAEGAKGKVAAKGSRSGWLRRRWLRTGGSVVMGAVLSVIAVRDFMGFMQYGEYRRIRREARSIESGFPELEDRLMRAVGVSNNPRFHRELGRLYTEMAQAMNTTGREEEREIYLDQAAGSLGDSLKGNPLDAFVHYEMGMAYLLSNYPLLTYADRAKQYLREALVLKPADEFLNVNILVVYFTLWDGLSAEEQAYALDRLEKMTDVDAEFRKKIEDQWIKNFGTADRLNEILHRGRTTATLIE